MKITPFAMRYAIHGISVGFKTQGLHFHGCRVWRLWFAFHWFEIGLLIEREAG